MSLPAHTTKVGDWVRPCRQEWPGKKMFEQPSRAYAEPEFRRVVQVTNYDIVVQDGPWKFPCTSWIRRKPR